MMGTSVTVIKFLKSFLMVISVFGCLLSYLFVARVLHHSTLTTALLLLNG